MLLVSYAILLEFLSFAIQITACGLAIHWAESNFVVVNHPFPFNIAFSFAIIISILQFIIFSLFMFYSRSTAFLWTWITLLFSFFLLSIFLVSPISLDAWVNQWDARWTNISHTMSFQYESNCCGWENFMDRAITDCPFSYISGCKTLVVNWIQEKYNQIYLSLILSAFVSIFPVIVVLYVFFAIKPDTFWSIVSLPFVTFIMETRRD